jgi:hypothetical protein
MGRLPIYGKTPHTWEDFPYVGSPIYGKMGSLPIDWKFSHRVEVSPHVESLPIDGKVFPHMGSLPI